MHFFWLDFFNNMTASQKAKKMDTDISKQSRSMFFLSKEKLTTDSKPGLFAI